MLTCSYFHRWGFSQTPKMSWMEIQRCRPAWASQLPRPIGRSRSATPRQSSGAADGGGGGSNSSICKGPDSRRKLTGVQARDHLFPSQITFTVHRRGVGHIFGPTPESLNPGYSCILHTHTHLLRICHRDSDNMGGGITFAPPRLPPMLVMEGVMLLDTMG